MTTRTATPAVIARPSAAAPASGASAAAWDSRAAATRPASSTSVRAPATSRDAACRSASRGLRASTAPPAARRGRPPPALPAAPARTSGAPGPRRRTRSAARQRRRHLAHGLPEQLARLAGPGAAAPRSSRDTASPAPAANRASRAASRSTSSGSAGHQLGRPALRGSARSCRAPSVPSELAAACRRTCSSASAVPGGGRVECGRERLGTVGHPSKPDRPRVQEGLGRPAHRLAPGPAPRACPAPRGCPARCARHLHRIPQRARGVGRARPGRRGGSRHRLRADVERRLGRSARRAAAAAAPEPAMSSTRS